MPTHPSDAEDDNAEEPGLRQKFHAATGDRDAEAEALVDRADSDVDDAEAEVAVKRAHGDVLGGEASLEQKLATTDDAEAVHDEQSD